MYFQTGNKKEAERLVKNIIKIVIKIGILHRNNQFNADELKIVERFRSKFQVRNEKIIEVFFYHNLFEFEVKLLFLEFSQTTQMAVISFHEVDFSFDLPYLQKSLSDSQAALKTIVERHLTDKSLSRIDEVFGFFNDAKLLETAFRIDSPYRDVVAAIVADLNAAMDSGDI